MAKKYKYRLHPKYEKKFFLGVVLNKERINLVGEDHEHEIKDKKTGKGKKVKWRKATEKDLEAFYNHSLQGEHSSQKVVIREDVGEVKST